MGQVQSSKVYVVYKIEYSTQPKVRDQFNIKAVFDNEDQANRYMDGLIKNNYNTDIQYAYCETKKFSKYILVNGKN